MCAGTRELQDHGLQFTSGSLQPWPSCKGQGEQSSHFSADFFLSLLFVSRVSASLSTSAHLSLSLSLSLFLCLPLCLSLSLPLSIPSCLSVSPSILSFVRWFWLLIDLWALNTDNDESYVFKEEKTLVVSTKLCVYYILVLCTPAPLLWWLHTRQSILWGALYGGAGIAPR